ncbi:MAG TPA: DUF4214 domain-containing protein [Pyrinomonadaceae bacterium]|nr:DUF4214 domain-containing protein [Pyrinomonadaceae bacterium]
MNRPPLVLDDQFVQNFFTYALARSPFANENTYWYDQLRVGYGQGQETVKLAGMELGRTLFESAEYAARNRDNHWYVYDLYKTYLMRDPDSTGWANWEATAATNGREYVRRGFEESTEFSTLMANIVPNGSATASASSLISARVDPRNQPGSGMLTRDANWSVPLLSLPGRAGLDLGLSLSYSSVVWTRSGPYIYFDEDDGFPSPGFRLGFPTVQRKAFDAQTARNAYLLVTAAGRRVELRQVGTSNVYDAADSSYLRLIDNGSLVVQSTDGTKLTFTYFNGEYHCIEVKDRNGNYITINYNSLGQIANITDTLSRVITFNYDSNANLLSITQSWAGQPSHQWVSFGWSTRTMQPSFSDASLRGIIGTSNGTVLPVITQVALNDTSYFTFDYSNSLQLSVVRNNFGTLERNSTTFTYETPAGDAPRLVDSRLSVLSWTGINGVPAQVITQYSVAGDGACVMTAPDGTVYKEYYGTGWQKGLTVLSEVWLGGVRKKWTTTAWTQDDTNLSYQKNPRPYDISIYDEAGNRRRVETIYTSYNLPNPVALPTEVKEYAADGSTVSRRTTITYFDGGQAYIDRRVLGLLREVILYDGNNQPQSKVWYDYDWGSDYWAATPQPATQHDASGIAAGRGNLCWIGRWDVSDVNNFDKSSRSYIKYNKTGSVIATYDHYWHGNTISYTDSFSDSVNRNTFAYPTTVTDADGFSSSVQYNFDLGATTRTQSPAPAGQSQGAIQTMSYNSLGQLERITTTNNGAYKHFIYGSYYTQSFATVNNIADELYSIEVVDGLGRVIGTAGNHPDSTGGYRSVMSIYDQMGRLWKQSNPTEINVDWVPVGDDAAGFYYTQQTYDWKGRPLITSNTDGTTREASYTGCGCAGGEVVTLTDEGTIDAGVAKRRQQKIYSDVLGRTAKTELLNWQGGSVYSTIVNTYNARDQLERIRQFVGAEGSGSYQDTMMTYDGFGRLKTQHRPEQEVDPYNTASTDHTTWDYNSDDTVQKMTDPRGVTATYTYNARHLATAIVYAAPSPIPATPSVTLAYDGAGNRTSMTDGTGSTTYQYDQLSRMRSETRTFTGLTNSYSLNYDYNLANELISLSLPTWSQIVGYNYDSAGRLNAVTANGFSTWTYNWQTGQTTYTPLANFASSFTYRAWGGIKHIDYGNSTQINQQYNQRLQTTNADFTLSSGTVPTSYDYYADGRIHHAYDSTPNPFDRAYEYDHVGRLKQAYSGAQARGGTTNDGPYWQSYGYDAFDNLTNRTNYFWAHLLPGVATTYTNNRSSDYGYDAAGNVTGDAGDHTFDAAGNQTASTTMYVSALTTVYLTQTYDGDGRPAKQTEHRVIEQESGPPEEEWSGNYFLRSSVLNGAPVIDLTDDGMKEKLRVFAAGTVLAEEGYMIVHGVEWRYPKPNTGSWISSTGETETDPMGADVTENPYLLYQSPSYLNLKENGERLFDEGDDPFSVSSGCSLDGMPVSCSYLNRRMDDGSVETQYLGLYERDPNLPAGAPNRFVPVTRDIRNYGLGIYEIWMPPEFRNEYSRGGWVLFAPQRSVKEDDQDSIQGENNGNDCGIVVNFKPGTTYPGTNLPNGPSTLTYNGQPNFGLGFSVSGWVRGGGIGTIGVDANTGKKVANPNNPKGRWSLEQWTNSWIGENGRTTVQKSTFPDLPLNEAGLKVEGDAFGFYDHPGGPPPSANFGRFENHLIKVYSGKTVCDVKFHFIQIGNTIHWGPGLL